MRVLITGGGGFIGANLVAQLLNSGVEIAIVSRHAPQHPEHSEFFRRADVLDLSGLQRVFTEFEPTHVVHLAARTGFLDRADREGYRINTEGTHNLIQAISRCTSVTHSLFASSNVIHCDGLYPSTDESYRPAFLYGESKAMAECLVEEDTSMKCTWSIVRPCQVWGPWFGTPYREFFLSVSGGRYFHLGAADAPKLLGYVGNVAHQILGLLRTDRETIHRHTLYLADDQPTTIRQWADEIARQLERPRPRTVPATLARLVALVGDQVQRLGYRNPPLTSRRLANMRRDTTEIEIEATRKLIGPLPFTMEQGVRETIAWLRDTGQLSAIPGAR